LLRNGELQFITEGIENGITFRLFVDRYGDHWRSYDFEAARKYYERQQLTRVKAYVRPNRPVVYKRKVRR
jgi:hypothetical protein